MCLVRAGARMTTRCPNCQSATRPDAVTGTNEGIERLRCRDCNHVAPAPAFTVPPPGRSVTSFG